VMRRSISDFKFAFAIMGATSTRIGNAGKGPRGVYSMPDPRWRLLDFARFPKCR
jgi:hypothetical protein